MSSGKKNNSFVYLFKLLRLERRDIWATFVYSLFGGIFSLVIPMAVQALVNTVAFGTLIQPIVVLTFLVVLALLFAGLVRFLQIHLVEYLQRRIFVRTALQFSYRFPKILPTAEYQKNPPSLWANRFFEVVTIQKTLQTILLDGIHLALQILIGFVLMAFYHPYLLVFDVILVGAVFFVVRVLGRRSVQTSIDESYKKYEVQAWLEDLADQKNRAPLFPVDSERKVFDQTEAVVSEYLVARSSHYRIYQRQVVGLILVQVFASAVLLGLGGYLVIRGQLTLGQLVAAELILTGVVGGFAKLSKYLENLYDLVASLDKLGHFLELPIEKKEGPAAVDEKQTVDWEAQSSRGTVRALLSSARTPRKLQRTSWVLAALFVVLVFCLIFVPWVQTAPGAGRVVAFSPTDRPQKIDVPMDGKIKKWFVHEGSRVSKGDAIVEMTDIDPEILNRLDAEREAVLKRLQSLRVGVQTSQINVERQKKLWEQGLAAKRSWEMAQLEYIRYLTDEANASAELSRFDVRLARQRSQLVVSPADGVIMRRVAGQESRVFKAGEVLATLVPDTDSRAVELWVNGNDMPLIQEGQSVRVQFEGWPALQFSGWPSVAVGSFGGTVSLVDPADNGHGQFRVLVVPAQDKPWPAPRFLRQGVRVLGWVLLNEVSLGFELWRQFNQFPPTIQAPVSFFEDPSLKDEGKPLPSSVSGEQKK